MPADQGMTSLDCARQQVEGRDVLVETVFTSILQMYQ
jgi:hypothetical protein